MDLLNRNEQCFVTAEYADRLLVARHILPYSPGQENQMRYVARLGCYIFEALESSCQLEVREFGRTRIHLQRVEPLDKALLELLGGRLDRFG